MWIKIVLTLALLGVLILSPNSSFATPDEAPLIVTTEDRALISPLTPSEIYSRTQAVLNYYNSPKLPSGQEELNIYNGVQSYANIQKLLQYFDVNNAFSKLFTLTETELKSFDDIDGKSKLNFKINLNKNLELKTRINATAENPLKGLRVAIDPGHMGESFWDEYTGKFVKDGKGNYLSEGVMALQTALLLQAELKALGAEVELTRTGMTSVTDMKLDDLPVSQFAKTELLEHVYSPWFLKLLPSGTGTTLYKAFDDSADRKKLWGPTARYTYFILKEDLWARADKINNFKPDIVLIIHYDTATSGTDELGLNPNSPNETKIFVTGGYFDTEFGSRKARKQFASKLLNQHQWDESLNLSKKILEQFNKRMGLTFPTAAQGGTFVAPGIFARNLTLPRFLNAPAVAYLECLFYNRPQEFYAFTNAKHPMIINGVNYPYSDRLLQVVSTIRQGVINYTSSLE